MNGALLLLDAGMLLAAPSPSDGGEFNSVTVSPGLPGFFAAFVLAVMVVLLGISMTRHTRRIQAQARLQERIEAEEQAGTEEAGTDQTDAELPDAEKDSAPGDSAGGQTPRADEDR